MKKPRSDQLRLTHILKACDILIAENEQLHGSLIGDDDFRYWAFVKMVEIIGEAVYGLSREFKSKHQNIDWQRIAATRHIMVHEYDDIDDVVLWRIIRQHIPALREQISSLLKSLPS